MALLLENLPLIAILLAAGATAGFLAGLFGVGGGIVVVPVIFFVMQGMQVDTALAMSIAVSTSLTSIVLTASASTRAHHRLRNVDWHLVRSLAPPLLIGVVVGGQLIAHLRSTGFVVFFGLFLFLIALNMLWRSKHKAYLQSLPGVGVQWTTAMVVGAVSAVAGVGGGAMGVPLLTAANVPAHRAIGSCAAFGLLIALVGATSIVATATTPAKAPSGTWHLVYLPALVALLPMTVLTAPWGAKLGKRLSPDLLRRLFALLLVVVSSRMLFAAWGGD